MKSIIVDANLLCLIVAGQSAPNAIGRHKRLKAFTLDDYKRVMEICSLFSTAITCPNVLTEVSNLLANTNNDEKSILLNGLADLIERMNENHVHSFVACAHPIFSRLGLTDAVLLCIEIEDCALLSVDLDLVLAAQAAGKTVVNYNWIRDQKITLESLGIH